jgi:hypothetical protein
MDLGQQNTSSNTVREIFDAVSTVLAFLVYSSAALVGLAIGAWFGMAPIIWFIEQVTGGSASRLLPPFGNSVLARCAAVDSWRFSDYVLLGLGCWGIIRIPDAVARYWPRSFLKRNQ